MRAWSRALRPIDEQSKQFENMLIRVVMAGAFHQSFFSLLLVCFDYVETVLCRKVGNQGNMKVQKSVKRVIKLDKESVQVSISKKRTSHGKVEMRPTRKDDVKG